MKNLIIPTIFATSKKEFNKRFFNLIKISKNIQIDFMDGIFVKAKSISIKDVPNLRIYKNNFEAHLMFQYPEKYIKNINDKGFNKVIFHFEGLRKDIEIINLVKKLKKNKMRAFIALNPGTEIHKVLPFISLIDGVLLMGHTPGREHINFLPSIYKKIKNLRQHNKKIIIQIDGGVNDKNIKKISQSGANIFNVGSYVADAENPNEKLNLLKNKIG
ncbi:hypothetical protein HYW75_05265 [Candidatus Pacearchaeota archaeon]|nr:hypothetical protein [Candidatus Pacearchaeota archaeon]